MSTPNVRYRPRGDTAANWSSANPTLGVREIGLETDTLKFKVGDGATAWSGLSYWAATALFFDGGTASRPGRGFVLDGGDSGVRSALNYWIDGGSA